MPEQPAHYTVLARRFRPQTFGDVVGQEHVGQALCNAIKSGRVAHAYLFTGARGVGKTSTARIFAKALNCPSAADGIPCNECDVCQSISAGQDVDVLEIDGASNRGIDDIRQLRANVNVKSMRSRYKVYIIDEVHMLTKEAFNALLKTLEEPPPNVKFVFCTTEPNKVPDTILSRCQRFDFGTIATGSIALRLQQIAEIEGIQVDADAVELVARRAAGSMRDSQSLFDQLLAFGEEHITSADVHKLLGTAPDDRLVELIDALIRRDRSLALQQLEEAFQRGVQLGPFSDQLLEYLRDLLILLAGADDLPLQSVGNAQRAALKEQGNRWGLHTVSAAMQILAETKGRMTRVNYGRALLELALVRISLLEDLDDIGRLVARLATGTPPATPPSKTSSPSASPTSSERPSEAFRQKLQSKPATPGASPPPAKQPAALKERPSAVTPSGQASTSFERVEAAVAPVSSLAATATLESDPEPDDAPPDSPSAEVELTPASVDAFWAQLLCRIPDTLANHLKNAGNLAISGPNLVEIAFPASYLFSMNYCQRPETLRQVRESVSQLAGRPVDVRFKSDGSAPSPKSADPRRRPAEDERLRPKAVENDPFIQQAASLFGGTVVDVRRVLAEPIAAPATLAEPMEGPTDDPE